MPANFQTKEEFLKHLSRYMISDITKELKQTNAREFTTLENLTDILQALPENKNSSCFIHEFYPKLPLDQVLNLAEQSLQNLSPGKAWLFLLAAFRPPLQQLSANNLIRINKLQLRIGFQIHNFLSLSSNFASFSINNEHDIFQIINLFALILQPQDLIDVIKKCQAANPKATSSFLHSPNAIDRSLEHVPEKKARRLLHYILEQVQDKDFFAAKALSSEENFDSFINLLALSSESGRDKLLTALFSLPVEQVSAAQLIQLKPFIDIKSQYMKANSTRLYQQELLSSEQFFDYLSTLGQQQFHQCFNRLNNQHQLALFQHAEHYFLKTEPTYGLMKQYQDLEDRCFFVIRLAQLSLSIADNSGETCAPLGLIFSVPIDLIILAIGAIPAFIGLFVMCKRYAVEQTFRDVIKAEDFVELPQLRTQYLSNFSLWNDGEMQAYRERLMLSEQAVVGDEVASASPDA